MRKPATLWAALPLRGPVADPRVVCRRHFMMHPYTAGELEFVSSARHNMSEQWVVDTLTPILLKYPGANSLKLLVAKYDRALSALIVREAIMHTFLRNNGHGLPPVAMVGREGGNHDSDINSTPCSPYLFYRLLQQLKEHDLNLSHIEIANYFARSQSARECVEEAHCSNLWQFGTVYDKHPRIPDRAQPNLRSRALTHLSLRWVDLIYLQIGYRENANVDDSHVVMHPQSVLIEALQLLANECPHLLLLSLREMQGCTLTNGCFVLGLPSFKALESLALEVRYDMLPLHRRCEGLAEGHSLLQDVHGCIAGITDTSIHDIVEVQRSARTNNRETNFAAASQANSQPLSEDNFASQPNMKLSALSLFATTSGRYLQSLTLTGVWIDGVGPLVRRETLQCIARTCPKLKRLELSFQRLLIEDIHSRRPSLSDDEVAKACGSPELGTLETKMQQTEYLVQLFRTEGFLEHVIVKNPEHGTVHAFAPPVLDGFHRHWLSPLILQPALLHIVFLLTRSAVSLRLAAPPVFARRRCVLQVLPHPALAVLSEGRARAVDNRQPLLPVRLGGPPRKEQGPKADEFLHW
eukprot:scaffold1135_cov343-Prasinococcus_capsulatus_cf.AAC.8